MAHDHHHHHGEAGDTYFLDQVCMLALGGAFGVICLTLFFWQKAMLNLLLGQQFHIFVVVSGGILLVLAVIRAATLWIEASPTAADRLHADEGHHHHEHSEHCDHDHVACDHDHGHGDHHDHHGHSHSHDHGHHHHHDHSHADHDHGWAPWRYVVLLVPVILFLLGVPNKGLQATFSGSVDLAAENQALAVQNTTLPGLEPWVQLAWLSKVVADQAASDAFPVDMKRLLASADDRFDRDWLKGKTVSVRGQFVGSPQDPRFFQLVRFQIQCCGADAVPKPINAVCKEPVLNMKNNAWCEVTGRVDYVTRGQAHVLRLLVPDASKVVPCNPDINPYIQ